ncbi:MAG TPA: hypothetical protein VFS15_09190 [Kofleriaceae bacterium]|nr:hypothetical protein [Kofleriaceae bacterium]
MLCLPADRADACVTELRAVGLPAARIGALTEHRGGARITLR